MQDGATPLHLAGCWGCTDVAALLLDRGAAIEAQEKVSSISLMQGVARVHIQTGRVQRVRRVYTRMALMPC